MPGGRKRVEMTDHAKEKEKKSCGSFWNNERRRIEDEQDGEAEKERYIPIRCVCRLMVAHCCMEALPTSWAFSLK